MEFCQLDTIGGLQRRHMYRFSTLNLRLRGFLPCITAVVEELATEQFHALLQGVEFTSATFELDWRLANRRFAEFR